MHDGHAIQGCAAVSNPAICGATRWIEVKYFYVEDLEFWRYRWNPHYDELVTVLTEDAEFARPDYAFGALAEMFQNKVEQWSETAAQVRGFWEAAQASR